jgi:hypothetical protein
VERFRLCVFRPVICVGTGLGPLVWTRHPFEQRHHPSPGCGASMDLGTPATKHWDVPSGGGKAPKSAHFTGKIIQLWRVVVGLSMFAYQSYQGII